VLFASLRDLQWRRRRFLIGVLAAGLVFALALVITGISQSFHNEVWRTINTIDADEWVVSQKASGPFTATTLLPESYAEDLARQPGVEKASPLLLLRFSVQTSSLHYIGVVGVDPGGVGAPGVHDGRALRGNGEVVADKALGVGVGKILNIGAQPFRVVGRTDGVTYFAGQPAVFVSLHDAQVIGVEGQPLATAILVRGHATNLPPGTHLQSNKEVFTDLRRPMKSAGGTIDMMRILLWIVAAGIIGSILYLQAIERTRDFAVFKATGVTGRALASGLAAQAVVLALLATAVAILLSIALAPIMPIRAEIPGSAFVLMPVVAIVISVLASLFGLRRAVAVDPALAFSG
jgi:putative ABC transport system permease protein